MLYIGNRNECIIVNYEHHIALSSNCLRKFHIIEHLPKNHWTLQWRDLNCIAGVRVLKIASFEVAGCFVLGVFICATYIFIGHTPFSCPQPTGGARDRASESLWALPTLPTDRGCTFCLCCAGWVGEKCWEIGGVLIWFDGIFLILEH